MAQARTRSAYIALVTLAGALTATVVAVMSHPHEFDALVVPLLLVAMAASIWSPLRFQRRAGVLALDVSDGVVLALLFVAPLGLVPALAATAALLGNAMRTREPTKLAFNFGAHALKAAAATLVVAWAQPIQGILSPSTVAVAVAAMAAYFVADILLYGTLFALLEGRKLAYIARDMAGYLAISSAGNTVVGLLLAFIILADRAASIFAFVLVAIAHIGYRGYALALEERRRNERLQEVTRELAGAIGSPEGNERYVRAISRLFEARAVKTVLIHEDLARIATLHDGRFSTHKETLAPDRVCTEAMRRGAPVKVTAKEAGRVAQRLTAGGYETALSVPVIHEGQVLGAITVFDPGGLESSTADIDLLRSLANDAAIAARNLELFEAIEHERQRLADETQKLQDVIGAATDGIVLIDSDGRVRTWNPAMARLVGLTDEQAVGQPWFMAMRMRGQDVSELPVAGESPVQRALAGRPDGALELQLMRTDGEWRWVRITASAVRHGAEIAGAVLVVRDVHHERETEELKSDFVATVSHELRTPLTPLKGFLLTIVNAERDLTPEQLSIFHSSMLRQVERLEGLVADLFVVADLDRGTLMIRPEPCDVTTIITDAVATELPLDAPDRIVLDMDGPIPAIADRAAAVRIVRALVSNAVKHTEGQVTVRASVRGDEACIAVRDEGPGIPARDQERIFDRFARLGNHLTRSTQGTGLGLSIARSLAERMGGRLTLASGERGATFLLALPLVRADSRTADDEARAGEEPAPGPSPASIEPA